MLKIGMVDVYLDNWHTNHYPDFLRDCAAQYHLDVDITHVYAQMDRPGGLTTQQWCQAHRTEACDTYEALLAAVDAVMVMCADDCYPHEALADKALRSGKRVYCDKTFAPDLAAAKRMFALADAHRTQVYSASAQRWAPALQSYLQTRSDLPAYCVTMGPGDIINYSVHQLEMSVAAMGCGATKCLAQTIGDVRQLLVQYADGRGMSFVQMPKAPFRMAVSDARSQTVDIEVGPFYTPFLLALCRFFLGEDELPVPHADTLEVMAIQQAGREALRTPGIWVDVPRT